jgi:chemotaxis protein CheY-P-specific phosphatase CheC
MRKLPLFPSFHGSLNAESSYQYVIRNPIEDEFTVDDIKNSADNIKPNFIVKAGDKKAVVSTWVSAKRTRSYPFVRIYKTLSQRNMKKITIFPVVKDEGKDGCRDYIQWDTFSMCSFLNVYTIPSYYVMAIRNKRNPKKSRIRDQKYDSKFVANQIQSILETGDDAKAWNKKMIESIRDLAPHIIENYQRISKNTHVQMHGIETLREGLEIRSKPNSFRNFSRKNSIAAQKRESSTDQPKEQVFGFPKCSITLKDHYGGSYYWTSDGYHIEDKKLFLIEFKHSKSGIPAFGDVADALFKYHFFKEITSIQNQNSQKFETKLVIIASSGKKSTSELEHNPTLIKIKEECERNSILLICIGKEDGHTQIIQQLNSIKD